MARKTDTFEDDEDDGRTIADMGDVRRPSLLLPRRGHESRREPEIPEPSCDFSEELQSTEERMMVMLGALKAALSLGIVYVVVFGLAIAFMLWLWT